MDWAEVWSSLEDGDGTLTASIDAAFDASAHRAGRHIVCRLGCSACCIGPFEITALDVLRLRAGLEQLRATEPGTAAAIVDRSAAHVQAMADSFPGESGTGVLVTDERALVAFLERFAAVACPALDPRSGACLLYAHRPLSCRTFGLPARCGARSLPACDLNFTTASAAERAAATIEIDPELLEDALLRRLEEALPGAGSSIVAFALAVPGRRDRR